MSPDGRLREVVRFACRVCPRVGRYRLAVLAVLHSRLKPRFWTGQTVSLPACLGPPLPLQLRARSRGDIVVREVQPDTAGQGARRSARAGVAIAGRVWVW